MSASIILTSQGLEKLKKELEYLKKEKRAQVADRIRIAKDFGDLSENAEYHEAKEEQAFVEGRISEIAQIIKSAHVADAAHGSGVSVGSTVVVDKAGTSMTFQIVGATEADPGAGKISLESPLGQALLGKAVGDEVSITTPTGQLLYTIQEIR